MQGLGQVLSACLQIFQIEFTVDGLTFTLWNILLWLIVAGAVIYLLSSGVMIIEVHTADLRAAGAAAYAHRECLRHNG